MIRDMKSVFRLLSVFAVAALTLGSCHKDKMEYPGGEKDQKDNIGYLALGGLHASVMEDTENVATPTRAEAPNIDNFDVVIERVVTENVDGGVEVRYEQAVEPFKYGNRPSQIELEAGKYRLTISSATMQGAAWDAPVYSATRDFEIVRLQTKELNDIICRLSNIKVTVAYSADIVDQLDLDVTTMTVAVGQNSLVFDKDKAMWEIADVESAGAPAYFEPEAEESTLKLTLNCRYKDSDKDIVMTNSIKGVKAAQWRKINVTIQHASDGTATIGITCDTWTYDEEVTFDTTSFLMEDVLVDDTDMPEIKWEMNDMAEDYILSDNLFDEEGNFTSSINIDVAAKTPITSLVIAVDSDNRDFLAEYTSDIPAEVDLCTTTVSDYKLSQYGYSKVGSDATTVQLKFGKQAGLMRSFVGYHTYTITATDANGRETTATLSVKSGQSLPVSIVWVGYDITQTQTYVPGMTCELTITVPAGIADLLVEIISEDLTAEELAGVGLAANFSLVKDTQYFASLGNLGFPTGDAVEGKEKLNLSITTFLSILSGFPGDHHFKITVIDNEGNEGTETIKLHFGE